MVQYIHLKGIINFEFGSPSKTVDLDLGCQELRLQQVIEKIDRGS